MVYCGSIKFNFLPGFSKPDKQGSMHTKVAAGVFCKKDILNPLSANSTKWSNTLKQCASATNCLSVFDHFVKLALKGLKILQYLQQNTCEWLPAKRKS